MRRLAPFFLAACLGLGGCGSDDDTTTGGSSEGSGSSEKPAPRTAPPAPSIDTVIEVARKNPGFAGCKEVAPGLVERPEAATDPALIQGILCDNQRVANYWVWRSDADATAKTQRDDRPSFINGKIVVSTGIAVFAKQYDADESKTLPDEVKAACACGSVVTP